jgi:hypothetical protein
MGRFSRRVAGKLPMNSDSPGERKCDRRGSSQLAIILTAFADHLRSLGYARLTIQDYLRAADHFLRWLKSRRLIPGDINLEIVHRFLWKHLRCCQCAKPASRDPKTAGSALRLLFELLQKQGIIRQRTTKLGSLSEQLVRRFDRYLDEVCGLAESTRAARRRAALEFLVWRFGDQPMRLQKLAAKDLGKFVSLRAKALSPDSVRVLSDSLRSFLRFLQLEGHCPGGLDLAVPTLHAWNRAKRQPTSLAEELLAVVVGRIAVHRMDVLRRLAPQFLRGILPPKPIFRAFWDSRCAIWSWVPATTAKPSNRRGSKPRP